MLFLHYKGVKLKFAECASYYGTRKFLGTLLKARSNSKIILDCTVIYHGINNGNHVIVRKC